MFFNAKRMWKKTERARAKKLKEKNQPITLASEKGRIIKQIAAAALKGKDLTIVSYPNNGIEDPVNKVIREIKDWLYSFGYDVRSFTAWSHTDIHISWKQFKELPENEN